MAVEAETKRDSMPEKTALQHTEETGVPTPADSHHVGAEAPMTWKTWLVIFVSSTLMVATSKC